MAYVSPTNKTAGTLITASTWNQDIVSNQQAGAPDVFIRNGDMFVGTAADVGVRMGAGYGGQVLTTYYAGTPALSWYGRVEGLQIGTVTDRWYQPGTYNVTSSNGLAGHFQVGCQTIVIANGQTVGSVTVTFPLAYSDTPLVFATPSGTQACMMAAQPVAGTSLTQGLIQATRTGSTGDGTVTVSWISVGPFSYDGVYP